jgi:hypothetical protein
VTKNGFKIKIDTPQNKDFIFSWHSFGAKNIFQPILNNDTISDVPSCISPQILENNVCVDPPLADNIPLTEETIVSDVPSCISPQILENNVCVDPSQSDENTSPPPIEDTPSASENLSEEPLLESATPTP